jgi:hypothetical protein
MAFRARVAYNGCMKLRRIAAFALTLLAAAACYADRGRVRIKDGTLVTDTGSLLRGVYVALDTPFDLMPTEDEVAAIGELGLNAIHLYAENPWTKKPVGSSIAQVDKLVDWTGKRSLYLVISMAGWTASEPSTFPFIRDFWTLYAARYKDRTHVVFEICNEPSDTPFNDTALAMEREAYAIIRSLAPRSHILLMSPWNIHYPQFAEDIEKLGKGIDWRNASIAGHGYGKAPDDLAAAIRALKGAGIALTITEFQALENAYANPALIRVFEREGLSYLNFVELRNAVRRPAFYREPIEESDLRWKPDTGSWPRSLKGITYRDPFRWRKAAFCDEGSGWRTALDKSILEYIEDGSYAAYHGLDFKTSPRRFEAYCSSQQNGGTIEIRLDSLQGPIIGACSVLRTGHWAGDWNAYEAFSCGITEPVKGVHSIFLIFRKAGNMPAFNVQGFEFLSE